MLTVPSTPVPAISIHFAAEEPPRREPVSPFDRLSFPQSQLMDVDNAYRPSHLLPPPTLSPKQQEFNTRRQTRQLEVRTQSATYPQVHGVLNSGGLDSRRFQALVDAAKSPNAPGLSQSDLRRELALRVQNAKQIERRAVFLSKLSALPSPTFAATPVTPPESPAVFHFTLPSPGLVSPLALFESLENQTDEERLRLKRVEEIDFRKKARDDAKRLALLTGNVGLSCKVHGVSPRSTSTPQKPGKGLPSLDQLSKRLGGRVTVTRAESPVSAVKESFGNVQNNRLPAFLKRQPPTPISLNEKKPLTVPMTPTLTITPPVEEEEVVTMAKVPTPAICISPVIERESNNIADAVPLKVTLTPSASSIHTAKVFKPMHSSMRGSSLSSLEDLLKGRTARSLPPLAPSAPTPQTNQAALDKIAKRNESGLKMVEKLKRRVSAPAGARNPGLNKSFLTPNAPLF